MALSWSAARTQLREWRDTGARKSVEVLALYERHIQGHESGLGDELYSILEQVFIAALDCSNKDIAKVSYKKLNAKFPEAGSSRMKRLKGMYNESIEEWESASRLYADVLEADPTNLPVQKRQIAVLMALGQTANAIKELNKLLDTYQTDTEAWMQLADLYLGDHDYTSAAFCYEELILSNPQNRHFHEKYAEILFTAGGAENYLLARKYYAMALKLCPTSTRAMYGLYLASLKCSSGKSGDGAASQRLAHLAITRLQEHYAKAPNSSQLAAFIQDTAPDALKSAPAT